jgi:hypothetical protein
MIEIYLDKQSQLDVDVKVNGSDGKRFDPVVRLTLIREDFRISLPATSNENGSYTVSVPQLTGVLKPGKCEMEVEVLVDGKHFVPIKGIANLKEDIKPVVEFIEPPKVEHITLTASVRESISRPVKKSSNKASDLIKKSVTQRA